MHSHILLGGGLGSRVSGRTSSSAAEDAVAAWADQARQHDQGGAEEDLTLEKLNYSDDYEDDCDDPEQGAAHVVLPFMGGGFAERIGTRNGGVRNKKCRLTKFEELRLVRCVCRG